MTCPECQSVMSQICMYGTEEEITIEYNCSECQTLARLTWNPGKRVAMNNSELPY
jgi:hypothetical protein